MDLQQLTYFIEIAKLQNISKAAEHLYVSQPALSKSLRNLEEELDTQLFFRKGKSLYLTDAGELFYARVTNILNSIQLAKRELYDLNAPNRQPVRLKVRALSGILPEFLPPFLEQNPQISFTILQGGDTSISEAEHDLIMLASYEPITRHNAALLLQEDICLIVPEDHPLANKHRCSLHELAGYPMISVPQNRFFYSTLNSIFEELGFQPNFKIMCDDGDTIVNLIRCGMGIALLPEYSINRSALNGIKLVPMQEPQFARFVYLLWANGSYIPLAAQLLRKYLIKYFSDQYRK